MFSRHCHITGFGRQQGLHHRFLSNLHNAHRMRQLFHMWFHQKLILDYELGRNLMSCTYNSVVSRWNSEFGIQSRECSFQNSGRDTFRDRAASYRRARCPRRNPCMLCCIQSSCNLKFGLILVSFITLANKIQGDPSGRLLHFVDFDLVVPMPALFCLGSCESGRTGMALGNVVQLPT